MATKTSRDCRIVRDYENPYPRYYIERFYTSEGRWLTEIGPYVTLGEARAYAKLHYAAGTAVPFYDPKPPTRFDRNEVI
jgi:hypothetical protein